MFPKFDGLLPSGISQHSCGASLLLGLALLGLSGCQRSGQERTPQVQRSPRDRDLWNVCYMGQGKVGYEHVLVRLVQRDGQNLVSIEELTHLKVKRFQDDTAMEVSCRSTETPDGKLIDFETKVAAGVEPQVTSGHVVQNQLQIRTGSASKSVSDSLPWSDQVGGVLAVERSLWDKPMTPGESRSMKAFVPGPNQIAEIQLTAHEYERVKLLGGTYELLRIDSVIQLPGQSLRESLWTDRTGEILRRKSEMLNLESYRATELAALDQAGQTSVDLGESLSVPVERPLERPHETTRVRYRVRLKDGDPASLFVSGPSQQIEPVDPHSALVTVYALRPGQPVDRASIHDDPPTEADLRPNSLIQSDDPQIVAMAREVAGSKKDPWQIALALERHVPAVITKTDYTQAFATASEVLKTHTGDCTEHAVLLAALARASGIPARVAMGLVYMPGRQAFGYHMWTEVYINNQWLGIDGTLARSGIGAAHLKLAQSSLEGSSAYSTFLPVAQVAGKLAIEILEVQ